MSAPPKWVRRGEPGHVVVTGKIERHGMTATLLKVDVYDSKGTLTHADRMSMDKRTQGPRGYALDGSPNAPKPKKTHVWGAAVPVDGLRWGNRCAKCRLEREEIGAGGRFLFRRGSEPWVLLEKTPPCEVKA